MMADERLPTPPHVMLPSDGTRKPTSHPLSFIFLFHRASLTLDNILSGDTTQAAQENATPTLIDTRHVERSAASPAPVPALRRSAAEAGAPSAAFRTPGAAHGEEVLALALVHRGSVAESVARAAAVRTQSEAAVLEGRRRTAVPARLADTPIAAVATRSTAVVVERVRAAILPACRGAQDERAAPDEC